MNNKKQEFSMKIITYLLFFILVLSWSLSAINLQAQSSHIVTEIYQRDYGLINRSVIVLNGQPDYSIEQRVADRKLLLILEDTLPREDLPLSHRIDNSVLESIDLQRTDWGDLLITINTKMHYHLEYFDLSGPEYRLVFDIYSKETPETDWERLSFGKFYFTVGNHVLAETLMLEILESAPQITSANYYLGKILLHRGEISEAARKLSEVSYNDPEYIQAQMEMVKMGEIEIDYSHEMEQNFAELREYFLKAGNINRQQMILALASSVYGETEETEAFLARIDYKDPQINGMMNNILLVYNELLGSNTFPELVTVSGDYAQPAALDLYYLLAFILIILIATAIIVYLITFSVWNRKLEKVFLSMDLSSGLSSKYNETAKEKLAGKILPQEDITQRPKSSSNVTRPKSETKAQINKRKKTETREKASKVATEDKTKSTTKKPVARVKKTTTSKKSTPTKQNDNLNVQKSPYKDDELMQELVVKLYKDGWDKEAISKELQMDTDHIRWIIDSSEEKE